MIGLELFSVFIKRMTRHVKRRVSIALVTLSGLGVLLAPSAQACTLQEYTLPSISYLQMNDMNGYVVHLQRSSYQYAPTVRVWLQGQYLNEYYIPVNVYDIQVLLEGRYVLETWMGEVRQVYKEVPIVQACLENWTGTEFVP